MRISAIARRRYFRPGDNIQRGPRVNERIRVRQVRLIDENDEPIGIVETEDALRRAREAGLDLVEVSGESDPPVCRIRDFGKWKYEQSKKDKANRARSKVAELKEIRLGRSMKIDEHMIEIRLNQARRFLMEGHKVQIVQNFRGREMMHRDRGNRRMADIVKKMEDVSKLEMPPRMAGRRMTMILAPDKQKIDRIRSRTEGLARAAAAAKSAPRPDDAESPIVSADVSADVPADTTSAETVEARNT